MARLAITALSGCLLTFATVHVPAAEAQGLDPRGYTGEIQINTKETTSSLFFTLFDENGNPLCADANAGCNVAGVPTTSSSYTVAADTVFNISTDPEDAPGDPIHLTLDDYFGYADFLTIEIESCGEECPSIPPLNGNKTYYVYSHRSFAFDDEERSFFNPYKGDGTPDVAISGVDTPEGVELHGWPLPDPDPVYPSLEALLGTRYVFPYDCANGECPYASNSCFLARVGAKPTATHRVFTFSGAGDVLIPDTQDPSVIWEPVWDLPNLVVEFQQGTKLVVESELTAEGVTFTAADTTQAVDRWGGVAVYEGGSLSLDGVTVAHAEAGVSVYSDDVTITDSEIARNGTGIRSAYVQSYCPGLQACLIGDRSSFTLDGVSVSDNDGTGVLARSARDVSITDTEIRDNGGAGLFLWGAEVVDFRFNNIEQNGGAGISVADNADLSFTNLDPQAPTYYSDGLVRVSGNGGDEVYVGPGGYFFAGQGGLGGGWNSIFDHNPAANTFLLYNGTKAQIAAEETFWGLPSGPPAGSLLGWINADDPLPCDPTVPYPCSLRPTGPLALPAERGSGEWLREAIRSTRETLRYYSDTESAHLLAHALYAFQRLDADDVLGERAATMTLLRSLRGRLAQGDLPAFLRRTAEAALVVEVREALRVESYESAEGLLSAYAPLAEGAEARRSLALSTVAVDERAGQYAEALARIEAVLAELSPEEERLAEALAVVAGVLSESAEAEGRPGGSGHVGGALGEAAAASVEGSVLSAPYPNPSRGMATVSLRLAEATDVQVRVYDVLGREVAMLAEGRLEAGTHRFVLDAALPAGLYVIRVELGGARVLTQRLTVLR